MKYEELERAAGDRDIARSLYEPVYQWIQSNRRAGETTVVGINGPQGAGKSTLARRLVELFESKKIHAIAISIDDFYLTRAEQVKLAAAHSANPYLQSRGYPGTHDLELALETLRSLQNERGAVVPRYDKSAFDGKGDRADPALWTRFDNPVDVVLLEGWMLGFRPTNGVTDPGLAEINERLADYQELWSELDLFVFLDPTDHRFVVNWRIEAEENMKKSGKSGMSRDEAENYVKLFLPAYETYLPSLRIEPPKCRSALRVRIAQDRAPS